MWNRTIIDSGQLICKLAAALDSGPYSLTLLAETTKVLRKNCDLFGRNKIDLGFTYGCFLVYYCLDPVFTVLMNLLIYSITIPDQNHSNLMQDLYQLPFKTISFAQMTKYLNT